MHRYGIRNRCYYLTNERNQDEIENNILICSAEKAAYWTLRFVQLADELHLPNAGIVTVGTRKAKMPFIFKKIQKRLPEHQELEDEEEIQRYMALKAMFILRDAIKEFLVERYVGIGHEPRLTDQERQLGLLRGGSQNNSFFRIHLRLLQSTP